MASTITTNTTTTLNVTWADTTGDGGGFQSFTTTQAGTVITGTFYLAWIGTPTADLKISIRATSGGDPTGSDLGAVTYTAATLSGGTNGRTFTWTLTSAVTIADATVYALCFIPLANNSPYDGTTGFQIGANNSFGYTGGVYKRNSANDLSGTWDLGGTWDATTTIQQDDAVTAAAALHNLINLGVGT